MNNAAEVIICLLTILRLAVWRKINASNPLTHIDFLLFNRMDKAPVLAIEIDGTSFHAEGSRQAERDAMKNSVFTKCGIPYLRIRTDESGEKERIRLALEYALTK